MGRRLRYTFEDPNQPPLREDVPIPTTSAREEGHREAWGAYWRAQWSQPFPLDAMPLRLVVEGEEGSDAPDVSVELEFHRNWTAVHRLVRDHGSWVASGEVDFVPRPDGVDGEPSARDKRDANLDRHRHRVDTLLREAIALDEAFKTGGRLWEVIGYDWGIEAPRSRRGRPRRLDPLEIDGLMSSGMTAREVAERYGVHPKTPLNVLSKSRKRKI